MPIVTPSFSKTSFFKMFSVHTERKTPAFSNSSGLKSVFEKLRFRDGFVWTVRLAVEIKLRFQISHGVVWTLLKNSPVAISKEHQNATYESHQLCHP